MWITYSNNGTRIESDFWDWACMEKIIADYREESGLSDAEAHAKFWEDVKNYDPEDFNALLREEPLEKAIGAGRMDEIRADYLQTLNIDCIYKEENG